MPLPRVLEPEVMSGADEAAEYEEMDFSATDRLFAERAAGLAARGADQRADQRVDQKIDLIVDIGSGNAKIPLTMCSLLPAPTRVCAVDMSAEMLAVATRNRARQGATQLRLIAGDAKRLPFADASVSMVTSNSLIHHIPDPRGVFREIARITCPAAPILIRDLFRPDDQSTLDQLVEELASQWSPLQRKLFEDSLHAALTVAEVRAMLDECGLSDVRVAQITNRHWSAERP